MPDEIKLIDASDPTKIQIKPEPIIPDSIDTTLDALNEELASLIRKNSFYESEVVRVTALRDAGADAIAQKQEQIQTAIKAGAKTSAEVKLAEDAATLQANDAQTTPIDVQPDQPTDGDVPTDQPQV